MSQQLVKEKIFSNPVALFTVLTGKPFEYQIRYLQCTNRFRAFRAGRQVGKSEVESIRALHHAVNRRNAQVLCVAPSLRQSSLLFRKIREKTMHPLFAGLIVSSSNTMIKFKDGSEIICLPGDNPKTIMGYSPTLLIFDEAAFIKEEIYAAVLPSLNFTKGDMDLISTPFGRRGRFYEAFSDNDFATFHVRCLDCPVMTPEDIAKEKEKRTRLEFSQMFEGEFIESADTYFPQTLVLDCVKEGIKKDKPESGLNYFLGVDIARYGLDDTVYTISEVDRFGKVKIVYIKNTSKKPLTDVIGRVSSLHKVFNFVGIYIDSSGLGVGAVDSLLAKGLPVKSLKNKSKDSVTFTIKNKEEIYKNLKLLMEKKLITIPKHEKLINELCDLQYGYTESGLLKIHHPENGHDDYPDSLALSVAGIIRPNYKPYISI